MNFLCMVSGRFPEDYEIGMRAGVWGVEEKYEKKILRTSVGDHLVFAMEGEFRSIHRITSPVYRDDEPLWPTKDGSVFPHRIKISPPLFRGHASIRELTHRISFMIGKKWSGTITGANGVFRDLTDGDLDLIRSKQKAYRAPQTAPRTETDSEVPQILLSIFVGQIQTALEGLLEQLGLVRTPVEEHLDTLTRYRDSSAFSMTTRERTSGKPVVLAMDTSGGGAGLILEVLRKISALRQHLPARQEIKGLILTDQLRDDLRIVASEIQNISIRGYRVRFELDPEPEKGKNGWRAA